MMKNEAILALIQKHVRNDIETIQVRGMDSLDFHDVYIKSLVDLAKAAYAAGIDQGYEEGMEAARDMAAHYAQECGE
jgi:hypothetical protein